MAITYSDALAIVQVAYFSPALLLSLYVALKHGFGKGEGWLFLIVLSLLRIIGGAAMLYTISHPTDTTAFKVSGICSAIGLTPLLSATLGFILRMYTSTNRGYWNGGDFSVQASKLGHIPILIGLILAIVAATNVTNFSQIADQTDYKVAIVIYLVVYFALALVTVGAFILRRETTEDRRLLWGVIVAMPLILVRLLYSTLIAFSTSKTFSLEDGNETVVLVMEVLMEILVMSIYLLVGIVLKRLPKEMRLKAMENARQNDAESSGNAQESDTIRLQNQSQNGQTMSSSWGRQARSAGFGSQRRGGPMNGGLMSGGLISGGRMNGGRGRNGGRLMNGMGPMNGGRPIRGVISMAMNATQANTGRGGARGAGGIDRW